MQRKTVPEIFLKIRNRTKMKDLATKMRNKRNFAAKNCSRNLFKNQKSDKNKGFGDKNEEQKKFWYKIILPSSFAELEPNSLSQITKLSEIHSRTKKLKLLFTFWKFRIVCLCCGLV